MDEEVQLYLDDAKEKMKKAILHLEAELVKVRAGKASPQMLEGVHADFYGVSTPITQMANINTPDSRTLLLQPWDKNTIESINKAILAANIGLTPMVQSDTIRINIPVPTEERRKLLAKQARSEAEIARVSLRNTRRETLEELKKIEKKGTPEDVIKEAEEEVKKMIDAYNKKVDLLLEQKEKDIMTV